MPLSIVQPSPVTENPIIRFAKNTATVGVKAIAVASVGYMGANAFSKSTGLNPLCGAIFGGILVLVNEIAKWALPQQEENFRIIESLFSAMCLTVLIGRVSLLTYTDSLRWCSFVIPSVLMMGVIDGLE